MTPGHASYWDPKYAWSFIRGAAPPKRAPHERIKDFQEIYLSYDERAVREQASRCIQCPEPACVQGCPLNNRIPEWLALAAAGDFLGAAEISRSTSNMPEICSRVCPQERLCEGACILTGRTDPVSIGAVERFINEYALIRGPRPSRRRPRMASASPSSAPAPAGSPARTNWPSRASP